MLLDDANRLLDRIEILGNPCDLDVLVFFARHPRTLLSNNQLAVLLGCEFTQIAASLDVLQRAGLITVSENPIDVAQAYVFVTIADQGAGWLPDLLQLASTREGRLALVRALRERPAGDRRAVPRTKRVPAAELGPLADPPRAKRKAAGRRPDKRGKGRTR